MVTVNARARVRVRVRAGVKRGLVLRLGLWLALDKGLR